MSLLHYVTYKYIIIKDKRLGVAYYILAVLIVLYTLSQIFMNKAYLQFDESPKGNIRLLVTTPPVSNAPVKPSYCCPSESRCGHCRALDGLTLRWPVESQAVSIASFIKERWEKQNCDGVYEYDESSAHTPYSVERESQYFTKNPEEALIKIEHSITASDNTFSASHRMMDGVLLAANGTVLKVLNNKSKFGVDKIFLKDFLLAAGISLDQTSDALNSKERTYRENGVVLNVVIDYRNSHKSWFGIGKPEYAYKVSHVTYSDYRIRQEIPIPNKNGTICERIVNKRYATRLQFTQGGKIGQYSLANFIFQLVSLMGLLTLTATIIDIIALYLVPNKDLYRQYVFDASPELRKHPEISNADEKEKAE